MSMKTLTGRSLVCLACFTVALVTASAQTDQEQQGQQGQTDQQEQQTQQGQSDQQGQSGSDQQGQTDQQGQQTQQGQSGQQGPQGPQRPQYLDLRYDEDWSHLLEVKGPKDFWDPIKYILLNDRGWYLTIGGEVRERWDNWHNANFGYSAAPWLNDSLERYMLHADWHLGEHFRIFTQFVSALEFGKAGGPFYRDRDDASIHQAFFDYRSSADPKHYWLLRVGRQEVALGADHFVATSDFFNARRNFDGVRMIIGSGSWNWFLDAMKPVWAREGPWDNTPENGVTTWGGGFFGPNPLTHQGRIGGFYVGLDTKRQLWERGLGRDDRQTIGGRIDGTHNGLDYTYELIGQFGTFTPVEGPSVGIRAWAVTSDTGFTFMKSRHYPRIALRSNVTSGDNGHGNLGTFNPLFPDTAYSGQLGLVGPSNVIDVTPAFRFGVTRRIFFLAEWSFFWRENTNDAIYSPSLNTTPISTGITGYIEFPSVDQQRFVGNQLSLGTRVNVNQHLTYTVGYNYFTVGSFIKDTPQGVTPGKDVGYFVTWFTYSF